MPYPPMRYVEAIEIEHDGQPMVLIRDPEDLCPQALAVPLPLFLVMTLLDGQNGPEEILRQFARAGAGDAVRTADLDRIVEELDELYLLQNERSAARRQALEDEFAALTVRPAAHAGGAYPLEPAECRQMFAKLFDGFQASGGPRPRALVAPHIDFRVGGRLIGQALARLHPARPHKLYIILGVAHHPSRNLFTLTDKDFQTPLGLVRTDRAAAARLRQLYGAERLAGEYVHKAEHSVEFQAVGLQYLHRDTPDFKILPLLCGSLHELMAPGAPSPSQAPEVRDFIAALRQLLSEYAGEACIIASVDLSHVGRKFGDEQGISELRMQAVRAADERMLGLVEALDPEGFFDHFRPDANARNVDAVTAVYVMLHALGAAGRAEQLAYEQWHERETDSMVTYAGVAIY